MFFFFNIKNTFEKLLSVYVSMATESERLKYYVTKSFFVFRGKNIACDNAFMAIKDNGEGSLSLGECHVYKDGNGSSGVGCNQFSGLQEVFSDSITWNE